MRHQINSIFLVAVMSFMTAASVYGAPARKVWRTVTMADGQRTEVMLAGDEHGHWHIDRNGRAVRIGDDGKGEYMNQWAMNAIKEQRTQRLKQTNARRAQRMLKTRALSRKAAKAASKASAYEGKKRALVIMIEFPDKALTDKARNGEIRRMFNEEGYSANYHAGSVRDYFLDQSYGKMDITFDVIGPITVSKEMGYYGKNDASGNDMHIGELAVEAIRMADAEVDFKNYDWDGDGEVDQVYMVYAGYGENEDAPSNTIWPHEWALSSAQYYGDGDGPQTLDGVRIDTYAMSAELSGKSGSTLCGIGTSCHEFSHCLGFPDFYDTDYSGGEGTADWDVMCGGSYNGYDANGECPAEYTSYERWTAGWIEPEELTAACFVTDMKPLSEGGTPYIIYNEKNRNEYYLLENRQNGRWTTYSRNTHLGHGMLVLHVDYDQYAWENNAANDIPTRQRMTYIAADGTVGTSYSGDTYPGTTGKNALTDTSSPKAALNTSNYDGERLMHKPVTDITENADGTMSFTFCGGIGRPEITEQTAVTADGFTVAWSEVEGAESYTLRAKPYEKTDREIMLKETFSKCTPANANTDISSAIDDYMETPGWKGKKIYKYDGKVKIGASKDNGFLITPTLTPTTGKLTIYTVGCGYKDTECGATVFLYTPDGKTSLSLQDKVEYGAEDYTEAVTTLSYDDECTVAIIPDKRIYLDEMRVYDGEVSLDQIREGSGKAAGLGDIAKAESATADDGTVTVEGIRSTSYTLAGLTASAYKVSIQANAKGHSSEWSKPEIVTLTKAPTGISETVAKTQRSAVYTISGQRVTSNSDALPKGVYIVNGKKRIMP